METEIFILPAHWAAPLINGDESGLEDRDAEQLHEWLEREQPGECVDVSEESYFSWYNDATPLGGDVAEFTFIYPPSDRTEEDDDTLR